MSRPATPKPKGIRRLERWLVGIAMAVVAFVLERVVMRSVRKGDTAATEPTGTTLTARGGEVDLP